MLHYLPARTQRIIDWLRRGLRARRPHPVTDIRDLGPYLRADIGITDTNPPFRRRR